MKFIMMQTSEGAKLPILFSDAINHIGMAVFAKQLIEHQMKVECSVVSAGFVEVPLDISVHGVSDSLGEMKPQPGDAERMALGTSVEFMPDEMAIDIAAKLKLIT